ncbi:MAG: hypothetical protein M0R21_00670 [Lentimicrobiaceae bacterium]|nr:hypothetical protein [Lentimicrobiaceae bacterium]
MRASDTANKIKLRFKVTVFIVCLIISICTWLVIKLSKDYNVILDYPVTFSHFPKELVMINQIDSNLHLNVSIKGFEYIFKKYFIKNKNLNIQLPDLSPSKKKEDYHALLLTSELLSQIQTQTNLSNRLISIQPDTLFFRMEKRHYKKVPVHLNLNLEFKKQYQLYDNIACEPDSIIISGTLEEISKIQKVETQKKGLSNVEKSETFSVKIKRPKTRVPVKLSKNTVNVFVPVERFTESSLLLPIDLNMFPEYHLRTFPDKAKIIFRVAMKDYKKIDPAMFAITVDPVGITTGASKLDIVVHKYPYFISNIVIDPKSVEYILLK